MLPSPGRALLVLFAAGVFSSSALAQEAPAPTAQLRAVTAAAVSLENERNLHRAFDYLYNLDFLPALDLFETVAKTEPDSATVCAFWASALLYEILAHQGSLQTQLFVTNNAFLRHPRLKVDPKLDQQFHKVSEMAEQRAQRRLAADPNDVDGLFALGLTYGNKAHYLAGAKAEYLAGLRAGEKAYDYHLRLRELHPEINDVSVVLGVRDYVNGSLSAAKRFVLFFLGARGNRERGFSYIEDAANYGEFLRTYAQILLVVAWVREEKLSRALPLAEDLRARYPRNPIFLFELARLYRQMERYPQALQASRALLADLMAHPHNPRVIGPEDALFEIGLAEAAQGKFSLALESLAQVSRVPDASKATRADALIERGKIFDRMGEREKALAEYAKVIKLDAHPDSVRLAKNYLKNPYAHGVN